MRAIADIIITNHGSVLIVAPQNETAREWLEDHTDGMWYGGGLCVEPRYIDGLMEGMENDGLVIH